MKERVRILFDECLGKVHVEKLKAFSALTESNPELAHILDFQSQGTLDKVWVPRVASEKWAVITADRGKQGPHWGGKLPLLCRRYGITHILLSKATHALNGFAKVAAIMLVWPDMMKVCESEHGCGYSLQPSGSGYKLRRIFTPEFQAPAPTIQEPLPGMPYDP